MTYYIVLVIVGDPIMSTVEEIKCATQRPSFFRSGKSWGGEDWERGEPGLLSRLLCDCSLSAIFHRSTLPTFGTDRMVNRCCDTTRLLIVSEHFYVHVECDQAFSQLSIKLYSWLHWDRETRTEWWLFQVLEGWPLNFTSLVLAQCVYV